METLLLNSIVENAEQNNTACCVKSRSVNAFSPSIKVRLCNWQTKCVIDSVYKKKSQ